MSSSSNREGIKDIHWLDDNESLLFLGEQPGKLQQLYLLNTRSRRLKQITHQPTSLVSYSPTPRGDRIAYIVSGPAESIWNLRTRREGLTISTEFLWNVAAGQKRDTEGLFADRRLLFQSQTTVGGPFDTKGKIDLPVNGLDLSPDGRYILIVTHPASIPNTWKEYTDPELHELTGQRVPTGRASYLSRYVLVDTRTGVSRILLDSPTSLHHQTAATWLPDAHSVAISGVYLPLEQTQGDEREARRSKVFTVEVNIDSGLIREITDENLKLLRWDDRVSGLIFEAPCAGSERACSHVVFRKGDAWNRVQVDDQLQSGLEITLEEDMSTRPRIFANDQSLGRKVMLLDLNPQFDHLKFAEIKEITWRGSDGREVTGGLYYPVDYVSGKKYPLIIQTHGWDRNKFWIDGPWTSAFAAQPLAGVGFIVLQMPDPDESLEQTPDEPRQAMTAYEGAIDHLDNMGLINRSRIGIIGFSRTGLHVRYALTHSKYQFAAASVTDASDGGYFSYLGYYNIAPDWCEGNERLNGGSPFGKGLLAWLENAPGFSMEKVNAPLRIVSPRSGSGVLSQWEWFAGLSRLGKPVEMTVMQDGVHIMQKPWDRLIDQQGNVDWFRFWLQGYEDPDPAKAEQYARWHKLRQMQAANDRKLDETKAEMLRH